MRKIHGVHFIKSIITSCTHCLSALKVYKLEVAYQSVENNKLTTYLLTDILFCESCGRGFLLDFFRMTTDSFRKRWAAIEAKTFKVEPNTKTVSKTTERSIYIENDRIVVREIHQIILNNQCTTCTKRLEKKKILLVIKTNDGKRELKEKTRGLHCAKCSNWFMQDGAYTTIQNKFKSYIIPVKNKKTNTANGSKPQQAVTQKRPLTKTELIERDLKATTRKTKVVGSQSINNNFDKTGRFIHSDATKRWKDYNSD